MPHRIPQSLLVIVVNTKLCQISLRVRGCNLRISRLIAGCSVELHRRGANRG